MTRAPVPTGPRGALLAKVPKPTAAVIGSFDEERKASVTVESFELGNGTLNGSRKIGLRLLT